MLPVEVAYLTYEQRGEMAILFLREIVPAEEKGKERPVRVLPIGIGLSEAAAIYMRLEGKEPPRPLTHDLLKSVIETLGARVRAVAVHALKGHVFLGRVELEINGEVREVDARPSDAIALALRTDAPIYVDERVMEESAIEESALRRDEGDESEGDVLESFDDDSFVKV